MHAAATPTTKAPTYENITIAIVIPSPESDLKRNMLPFSNITSKEPQVCTPVAGMDIDSLLPHWPSHIEMFKCCSFVCLFF